MKKFFFMMGAFIILSGANILAQSRLHASIAGKSSGNITAKELLDAGKLSVSDERCWLITSYRCSIYKPGGDSIIVNSNYDGLTSEIKDTLPTLPAGTKIYFEYIKVRDVHGSNPPLPGIGFTLR